MTEKTDYPFDHIVKNEKGKYEKVVDTVPESYNNDNVNHPFHYTFGKYEVLDILMDWFKNDPLLWQVGKYIARSKHKGNELEDLRKARFYLDKKISIVEEEEEETVTSY